MSSVIDTKEAHKHFKQVDPVMARLLAESLRPKAAPLLLPTPKPVNQYFSTIVNSIVSQQISVKAAEAVFGRVKSMLGEVTPEKVLSVTPEELQTCGLSRQKVKYIFHNAEVWPEIPCGNFGQMTDEAVITELTKLYGIGRWTAEMFLIFSLARPDVFSKGDLGLMSSLMSHYKLKPHYHRKIEMTIEAWSPHRTLASLTLWYHKDGGPVVLQS